MSNQQVKNLNTTQEMKDSGIGWIGEIPSEWSQSKIKHIALINKKALSEQTDTEYTFRYIDIGSVDLINGIQKYEEYKFSNAPSRARRIVENGDVIVSTVRTYLRAIANIKDDDDVIASTGFAVISPKSVNPNYLAFALKGESFIQDVVANSFGVSYPSITATKISNMKIFLPPLHEQQAIAHYLDEQVGKIDELIAEQKTAIEKWKAYKQSLITETVTKGLNPNVEMKDSGVEWIGEIPTEWGTSPIKHVGNFTNGYAFSSDSFKEQGVRVLKISNVQHMRLDWSDESYVEPMKILVGLDKYKLKENDLIFALTRPIISSGIKVSIFNLKEVVYINQRNAYFRSSNKLWSKWLLYIMLNSSFIQEFEMYIDKTGQQPNISTKDIGEIKIPLPPVVVQQSIVDFLDEKCLKIDESIEQKQALIKQLEVYKQSLIYECVTGKKQIISH